MSKVSKIARSSAYYDAAQPIQTFQLPFAEFAKFQVHKGQRSHETRDLRRFAIFKPTHTLVAAVALPDGSIYKADGHSRWWAAITGIAKHLLTETMTVVVYSVNTEEEAHEIYNLYDNPLSVKTGAHSVQSGYRLNSMELSTPWIVNSGITSGLSLAYKHWASVHKQPKSASKEQMVAEFKDAILLFDGTNPAKNKFIIGPLAGTLLALKKHGKSALPFVIGYSDTNGLVDGYRRDNIRMMLEFMAEERLAGRTAGAAANERHMNMMLACVRRHMGAPLKTYMRAPSAITASEFLS